MTIYVVKLYFNDKNGLIICPLCNCSFIFVSDYISHVLSNHEDKAIQLIFKLYEKGKIRTLRLR